MQKEEVRALSAMGQAALFRTSDIQVKILLDMSHNIKCVNAFDWDAQFPGIFADGGFDCVIENPPVCKRIYRYGLL